MHPTHYSLLTHFSVLSLPQFIPNTTEIWYEGDNITLEKRGLSNNVQLRIMALGASIVYGQGSTDGNGFRYGLRNKLIYDGNPVNMVGSRQSGLMADNDVEGWPGAVISTVAEKAHLTYPQHPNLVLVHVGTNDMLLNNAIDTAYERLDSLIDDIFNAVPGVTVVASTLLPNRDADAQARINIHNKNIITMVTEKKQAGEKITYVDFSSSWFSNSDLIDGSVFRNTLLFELTKRKQNPSHTCWIPENGRSLVS